MKIKKETSTFASYRVFELLKFLTLNSADVSEIIKYMESIDQENKSYSTATIYKYLTTLRTLGIEIIKRNNKFHIEKLNFTFDFTKEEVRGLKIISSYLSEIPEKSMQSDIESIVNNIKPKLSGEMLDYYTGLIVEGTNISDKYSDKEIAFINKFEKFIDDALKLNIEYKDENNEVIKTTVEAVEMEQKEGIFYFNVFDSGKGNMISIPVEKVLSIIQHPQKAHKKFIPTTTTFLVKGKLIKRYALKAGERCIGADLDGNLIIISQKEDKNILIKRLIGYGDLCEVISPKTQREKMINELDGMLKNYG